MYGFNPLEEISRKNGKSIGELKEEMSKGVISAELLASDTSEDGRFAATSYHSRCCFHNRYFLSAGIDLFDTLNYRWSSFIDDGFG